MPKKTDTSTEDKIKQAAMKLFVKKGFSGTSVREIAREAGINLALMNYYFRSKQKLFEMVMTDMVRGFLEEIIGKLNEEGLSFRERIALFVDRYIDLILTQPDLPVFILGELRSHPESFVRRLGIAGMFKKLRFVADVRAAAKGTLKVHPYHLLINLLGMCIFPFIARPMLQAAGNLSQRQFAALMEERKKMIPVWFGKMLE